MPWPCERMCHSMTPLPDGRLLVFGGRNKEGICSDMWLLDTVSGVLLQGLCVCLACVGSNVVCVAARHSESAAVATTCCSYPLEGVACVSFVAARHGECE